MATLKRQNSQGEWEIVQVIGGDFQLLDNRVSSIEDKILDGTIGGNIEIHEHLNMTTLDKLSEDLSGNVLFDGEKISLKDKTFVVQDTEPTGIEEGRVWIDTSDNSFYGLDLDELQNIIKNFNLVEGKVNVVNNEVLQLKEKKLDKSLFDNHLGSIVSESGKHDIRYFNEKLSVKVNDEWIDFKAGGSVKLPVDSVKDLKIDEQKQSIVLKWREPSNFIVNGMTVSTWAGTRVIRKTGSYPQNENDGVLVVNNGVRNQYAENGFIDIGLIDGTVYYYSLFTYTTDGVFGEKVDISGEAGNLKIYGVKIDLNNSNPETSITYIESAIGFTSAKGNNGNFDYGSWEDKFPFNQIRPCLFKEGKVNYYLNPNDFTQKADGTPSDITSGDDGDVMVEFPKIYWKFENDYSSSLQIKYSDKKIDETYRCLAHTRGTEERDKVYIGAYEGSELNSKMRSLSEKIPSENQSISTSRTLAQANGVNYEQFTFYQLLMLQILFIVMFKNLDSQTALGYGYSSSGNYNIAKTGLSNEKGMFYGKNTGEESIKFCGIENLWGNCFTFIDGICSTSNYYMVIGNDNYNNLINEHQNSYAFGSNYSGYISSIIGTTESGFIINNKNGSYTTYYCDASSVYRSNFAIYGGRYNTGESAGVFSLSIASDANQNFSYRLSYQ